MDFESLFGAVVAIAGFSVLWVIARKFKHFTVLALVLFIVGTEPLGYLLWGEPAGTTYLYGWMLGLSLCLIFGFWYLYSKAKW